LDTGGDRCFWHASGTAGQNDDAHTWRQRLQLDRRVRAIPGDHRFVGKGQRPAAGISRETRTLARLLENCLAAAC
jgi:hypothetical protein